MAHERLALCDLLRDVAADLDLNGEVTLSSIGAALRSVSESCPGQEGVEAVVALLEDPNTLLLRGAGGAVQRLLQPLPAAAPSLAQGLSLWRGARFLLLCPLALNNLVGVLLHRAYVEHLHAFAEQAALLVGAPAPLPAGVAAATGEPAATPPHEALVAALAAAWAAAVQECRAAVAAVAHRHGSLWSAADLQWVPALVVARQRLPDALFAAITRGHTQHLDVLFGLEQGGGWPGWAFATAAQTGRFLALQHMVQRHRAAGIAVALTMQEASSLLLIAAFHPSLAGPRESWLDDTERAALAARITAALCTAFSAELQL